MIEVILPDRGTDDWGCGDFGAPRGTRTHKGIDKICFPDSQIKSPANGVVTKLGYPYGDDLSFRYVEVMDGGGYRHRLFYVEPMCEHGDEIQKGDVVGKSQNISGRYRDGSKRPMLNHVHYEILDEAGDPVDPEIFWAS